MVVDPQVDGDVVAAAVPRPVADDEQRGALPAAPVPARVVAGGQRGEQPAGQRRVVVGGVPGRLHRQHHVLAGEDVALDRVAVAGHAAGPVEAGGAGVGGRLAVEVDDPDLPVVATLVLLQQPLQGDARGRSLVEVGEREALQATLA